MTNPDNVGGLQRYAAVFVDDDPRKELLFIAKSHTGNLVLYDDAIAYGELCRAAPAGGDMAVGEIGELGGKVIVLYSQDEIGDLPKGTKLYARPQDSAPAGSGEVDGLARWWQAVEDDHMRDGLAYPDDHVVVRFVGKHESATLTAGDIRAALLRKLQQGADKPLTADMAKALPGGTIDDTTFDQIEHALDRAGAPACDESGKWLTLSQRIAALASQGQEGGK